MTDLNEQFSAGIEGDSAAAQVTKPRRSRIPSPIFRFRPTLGPVRVVHTIRTQIIPKIVLALRALPEPKPVATPVAQDNITHVEQFAALVLDGDDDAARDFVEGLIAAGMPVDVVFLELLAPAARYLGTLWEADATDFASVTLGVSRLQRILRNLGDTFVNEACPTDGGECALLTTIPGEQHSFGLSMVAEFFRREGWNLCTGPFSSHRELTSLVHNQWFDVVGFSVSSDRRLDELRRGIADIRRESRNRNVGVILGGPMMIAQPDLVHGLGADLAAGDATIAPRQARQLVHQMTGRA